MNKTRGRQIEGRQGRIIEAAITCFRKFGPLKTSMNDIADAAGRQTGYRTFRSREGHRRTTMVSKGTVAMRRTY